MIGDDRGYGRAGTMGPVVATWPEGVERVAAFLRDAGVEARLEELPAGTATAQDAANAAGCRLEQVVKTLVFDCDGSPIVALLPGDRRADPAKLALAVGAASARPATAELVERATGFTPGSVAPFPLPGIEKVLMERTLLAHDTVWIGAGSTKHLASLAPTDLLRLSRAEAMDAVQEPAYHSSGAKGDA